MTRVNVAKPPRAVQSAATYYAVLGVAPGAAFEVIHKRYLELARELHPDVNGGLGDRFAEAALAFGTLKNAELRKKYDARLRAEGVLNCKRCEGRGLILKTSGFTARREVECVACGGKGQV